MKHLAVALLCTFALVGCSSDETETSPTFSLSAGKYVGTTQNLVLTLELGIQPQSVTSHAALTIVSDTDTLYNDIGSEYRLADGKDVWMCFGFPCVSFRCTKVEYETIQADVLTNETTITLPASVRFVRDSD